MDVAPTISTQGLSRRFGELVAVDNINLRVSPRQFFGFLGPNGAGKSTTIKMQTGLLAPSSGRIEILGLDLAVHPVDVKRQIGVVSEGMALFGRLPDDRADQLWSATCGCGSGSGSGRVLDGTALRSSWIAALILLVLAGISLTIYSVVLSRMDSVAQERKETMVAELCRA